MSDDTKKAAAPPAAPAAKGPAGGILLLVLPAVFAGAAAFGGAKIASAHHGSAPAASEHVDAPKPPGPTLPLDAFLMTVPDVNKKPHPMKVTMAIEFEAGLKEEETKLLVPRIRDSVLAYLRTTSYEQAIDATTTDKMRGDLLERVRAGGAKDAQRVLITDF